MTLKARIPSLRLVPQAALVAGAFLLLAGCGEKAEDRQIAAGLACLDSAQNENDAEVCLQKVDGLTSRKSYLIRCSANFIAQGFTGQRIADAFQKLKDNPGGSTTPTSAMMAYFVFAKNLPNHTADRTVENCTRSEVKGLIQLATTAKLATFVANPGGGILAGTNLDPASGNFDAGAIQAQLNNLANGGATPQQLTEIGNIATTAQSAYCTAGSTFKDQDVCSKLDAAITAGGGNPSAIATALLDLLTP